MIKYIRSSKDRLNKSQVKALATEIKQFLDDNHLNGDCRIYFNGMAWEHGSEDSPYTWDAETYDYIEVPSKTPWKTINNINPKQYMEYAGGYISISSEGSFYYVINPWYADFPSVYEKYERQFSDILQKYGCYYEPGEAWYVSIYDA